MTARFVIFELEASGRQVGINVEAVLSVEENQSGEGVRILGDKGSVVIRGTMDSVLARLNGTPATPARPYPHPGGAGS